MAALFTSSASALVPKSLTPPLVLPSPPALFLRPRPPRFSPIPVRHRYAPGVAVAMAVGGDYSSSSFSSSSSSRRSASSGQGNEPRETIMLPGCDYNHWLIVMEFPKDPAPSREQMIDTYLGTLATVLGSMEEAKRNMYAFSTTTYTGFQCTVDEETSEKFKGLPGVLWVLPDSYIDVKNKDYGGDKYINGEIIPCKYPTYQPKQRRSSKYESRRYERRRAGPPADRAATRQEAPQSGSSATAQ